MKIEVAHSDAYLLTKTPALENYLERIGAVQKSFRRYVVEGDREYGNQRKVLATITIDADGDIRWDGAAEPPTDDEALAIKSQVIAARWPTSIPAPRGSLPAVLKSVPQEQVFDFKSRDGNHTLFIQERRDIPEGKIYIPWSYWSDDQWRNMEPDGLLPLFGLEKLGDNSTVFIHEGAKAARHCAWMVAGETRDARAAYDKHPWHNELSGAAHLGWAGGATNPQRTDWGALRRYGVKNVYVIADNDQPGVDAISKISRLTLLPMTAILFDDHFPPGFDLGDPWPGAARQPAWWNGSRYLGPSFHDMCWPATWATQKVAIAQNGRPVYRLRREFVNEWALSKEPHLFAHRRFPHALLSPEAFNRAVAPFSDVDDVARLLVKNLVVHVDGVTYQPHANIEGARIINIDGKLMINTYRPPTITTVSGDATPFLDFMKYLVPDDADRHEVLRWCATLIARPDIRMRYALLLISDTQGVGKTTLTDSILRPLVGPWNASAPNEHSITEGAFNSWSAHKRLAVINEIYSGERRKVYDKLKSVISDDVLWVNRKFVEEYEIANVIHIVACSNSIKAIHLDDTDRRFLVPRITEEKRPAAFWNEFYSWLNGGGLGIIAGWAADFVRQHSPVATGERAPDTSMKREVIAASRSEGAQLAYDLAVAVRQSGQKVVLRLDDVRSWVAQMRGMKANDAKLESKLTLRKALVDGGLLRPVRKKRDGRISIQGRPVEIVTSFLVGEDEKWEGDTSEPGLKTYSKLPGDYFPVSI